MRKLNTHLISPFRHSIQCSPGSYIQLTDKGWVSLFLGKQNKKIQIANDGEKVFIESKSGKKEYRPFKDEIGTESGNLPSKLRPWYQYASEFVEAIRKKQPKIVVRQTKQVTSPETANTKSMKVNIKISTVFTLSGHVESTMKHR